MEFSEVLSQAVATLLKQGSHPTTILVEFEGVPAPVRRSFSLPSSGAEQREQVLFQQGQLFAGSYGDRVVQRVWLVFEAWMTVMPLGQREWVRPSRDPARREGLTVVELDATSPDLLQRVAAYEMRRNKQKKVTRVEPVPDLSMEQEPVTPFSVSALRFLEGFAEAASSRSVDLYAPLRAKIRAERVKIAILLG